MVGRDVGYEVVSSTLDGTEVQVEEIGSTVMVPLVGKYQAANCAVACGIITELMRKGIYIPDEAIVNGLANVKWPGRMEMVSRSPSIMFDVTHTPTGRERSHRRSGGSSGTGSFW